MIFVTGASGLVGSHLIKSLLAKDKQVVAFYRQTIPSFEGAEKVNWILGDILDVGSWLRIKCFVNQLFCLFLFGCGEAFRYALMIFDILQ